MLPEEIQPTAYWKLNKAADIRTNKAKLHAACNRCGIAKDREGLLIAMAMIESWDLSWKNIDRTKDYDPIKHGDASRYLSDNVTIFNLNLDMLMNLDPGFVRLRSFIPDLSFDIKSRKPWLDRMDKDSDKTLDYAVTILNHAFSTWGVLTTLQWTRGGRTTGTTGKSYDIGNYLKAVATTLRLMDDDARWLIDDRRPAMDVKNVTDRDR
jgi:hypothetical protein